jgi:hypothetical protein
MWWWQFDNEEPLQEDLVVYERFMEMVKDRQRMNEEKERQKAAARSKGGGSGTSYDFGPPS